jgi:hypothetical protein
MLTSSGHSTEEDMKVEVIEVPATKVQAEVTIEEIKPLENAQ